MATTKSKPKRKGAKRGIAADVATLMPIEPDARPILVVPPDTGGLNLRDQPNTSGAITPALWPMAALCAGAS